MDIDTTDVVFVMQKSTPALIIVIARFFFYRKRADL